MAQSEPFSTAEGRRERIRIGIGWAIPLLLILASIAGRLVDAALLIALVVSHEAVHLVVARGLGCNVESLRMMPLGGVLTLGSEMAVVPSVEITVSLAGPLHHLLLLALAAAAPLFVCALGTHWPFFVRANLSLAFFNLIPAYPLDGGRILRALLTKHHGSASATKTARLVGQWLAFGLAIAGAFAFLHRQGPLLCLSGLYLFWSASHREVYFLPAYLQLQAEKRLRLERTGVMRLRCHAVHGAAWDLGSPLTLRQP